MSSGSSSAVQRSGSFRKKNNKLFNPFHHGQQGKESSRSRSPTTMSNSDSMSSEEERPSLAKAVCATAPVCFPVTFTSKSKHSNGKGNYITEFPFTDDDEYKEFLKEPKYIKTFKKCFSTAGILKRLFLAQELNQNEEKSVSGADGLNKILSNTSLQDINDIQLGLNDNISSKDTLNIASSESASPKSSNAKASVWAMKFNNDGKYLATAGKGNNAIKVWKVLSSPLDRLKIDKNNKTPYASVFLPAPIRDYQGHTHDILAIDWSKNDFLLSASMDKTVKLWNIKKDECLRTFQHGDFVTSVKFHPTDDRFFVSGCLDHKVRLWSILENEVSYDFNAQNLVTAIGFTPNGNLTIVGTFTGAVYFLDTQNLELRHSIQLNKKRSATGAKITGIETFIDSNDIKVLITSNDSKVRLLSLRNRQLETYFKGLDNTSSQIIANVSDDNKFIISGSENHYVYIWSVEKGDEGHHDPLKKLVSNKKKRSDSTTFLAHHSKVTCAVFAPIGTQKTLSLSNDYIFELNSEFDKETKKADGTDTPTSQSMESLFDKSYIGSIIVTADDTGMIRVFRQDIQSSVRKLLIDKNKSSNKNPSSPTLKPTSSTHRLWHSNSSQHSLLSRNHSFRKLTMSGGGESDTPTFQDSPSIRSHGATEPTTPTTLNDDQGKPRCDVCDGDHFTVRSAPTGTGGGVIVVCTDCENQINTGTGSG